MGFHHRKLLHKHHYLASTMTSPTPSPSPIEPLALKPKQWLPSFDVVGVDHINHNHENLLGEATIFGIACIVGIVMFCYTISIISRYYYSRRHNHNNNTRRRNSPILFHVNGDIGVVLDENNDEGTMMQHTTWFIHTEGLQQSFIDSITVFRYRKEEGLVDGTECSVCLGEFEHEESLRLLPKCNHAFHIPCIDTWLRSHKNCPLCRAPVVHDATGSGTQVTEEDRLRAQQLFLYYSRYDMRHQNESAISRVNATEPDLNDSGQNHIENLDGTEGEGEDSEISDKIFPDSDKVNCHALIGSNFKGSGSGRARGNTTHEEGLTRAGSGRRCQRKHDQGTAPGRLLGEGIHE